MALLSIETCERKPKAKVRYAAPTGEALREFILPIFEEIISDCPADVKPVFKQFESAYVFPNGSRIKLAGTDNGHHKRLRGPAADLCIADEAGFMECSLNELVKDIFMPQLLYSNLGRVVVASTPPTSPAHEFVQYVAEAEVEGHYCHKTIWDNPLLNKKQILEWADESGCEVDWKTQTIKKASTTWRREYMAEIVTDSDTAVVPEFDDERIPRIVMETKRPDYCHKYVVIDTGFIDLTACLFLYHDFVNGKLVFEDELIFERPNSRIVAEGCLAKERELWGMEKPYFRWADGDLIVLQDLSTLHGYDTTPVTKDELEAQVNQARMDVLRENIIINPRCKNLISHIRYAVWDKSRRKFARSSEKLGHFDALAAFIYAIRHVNRNLNPWPKHLGLSDHTHFIRPEKSKNGLAKAFGS